MLEEEMYISSDMYIFTFVRNPYAKIISEYHWRMRNRSSAVFNEPTRDMVTFENYMELLVYRFPHMMDVEYRTRAHITPQHMFIDDRVNIYRFENFDIECRRLKDQLGIFSATPHVNKGSSKVKHTKRTIEIVNDLYKEDFKRVGYEMK